VKRTQKSLARKWAANWNRAGRALERIRRRELRALTTRQVQAAMRQLSDVFEDALRRFPPRETSGLVEQQAWFMRLRP